MDDISTIPQPRTALSLRERAVLDTIDATSRGDFGIVRIDITMAAATKQWARVVQEN